MTLKATKGPAAKPVGRKTAMLKREEETALISAWQNHADEKGLSRLCHSFEPLIRRIAGRFGTYRLPMEDLMQEGQIALIEAVGRFDTSRNFRFATYAFWSIRARIQEYVLRNSSAVRLATTREGKSLFFKLRYVQAALGQRPSDPGSLNARVAEHLGMPASAVERMDQLLRQGDLALNERLPNSEDEVETRLADDRPGPEALAMARDGRAFASRCLTTALEALDERERMIVRRRWLTDDAPTLKALGRELGLSTERVRQIEHAAVAKVGDIVRPVVERPTDLFADAVGAAS